MSALHIPLTLTIVFFQILMERSSAAVKTCENKVVANVYYDYGLFYLKLAYIYIFVNS
jgi:hypothetical protein